MKMNKTLLITVLSLLTLPMMATIVVPPASLAEMAYNADLVIYATAESHQNGNSYTNNFRVLEVIKGDVSKDDIVVVEEYGGIINGKRTVVSGDVDFQLGYNYVLFLSEVGTGNYKTRQLSMGVFEEGTLDNQSVIGRTGAILDIAIAGGTIYNYDEFRGLYRTADFVSYMRSVMDGTANWSYQNAGFVVYDNTAQISNSSNDFATQGQLKAAGPCPNDAPCHCSTLFGPPGASQTKYEDNNWTVCVAGDAAVDPTNPNNLADLQTAITAMNGMVGINIAYTGVDNACTTGCASGSASGDAQACSAAAGCNKMYVFFDDPCGQIADVGAGCAGTLGIGGHFAGSATHVDDCGATWQTACTPFFVMNNFGVCAPSTVAQDDYIAVLIHEMLHAVGVGHHYDADAFTSTAAGDNACGAAGANNPVNAPAGTISHDGSECSGIMNPVICNSPAPAPPDFSITALDNSCTDWMYNITSASNCAITNVMVTNAACNGDDLTFDVTFDYTDADEDADGNTTFSVEFDGLPVLTNQPVAGNANTDVGQTYSVTVTGPTAGGMSTITIRNDAVFACTGDALNVDLPQCPPPCANTCADLTSMAATDCGNSYYPDSNTYPGAGTTSMAAGDGSGSGCQDYNAVPVVLPAGSGASHTICTEYTAGSNAAAFIDFFVAGNPGCIDQSITLYEAATCTDASTLPGVTVTQPGGGFAGQATGLTGNTDYIICFTYTENGCADDFSGTITEICPDILEIGAPACMSMPDVTLPTDVCNGDNVLIDFGPNCVPNPDLGADSGYGIFLYLDNGTPTTFPLGSNFTFQDLIDGVDPNLAFIAVNAGGCTDLDFALGLVNGICDPVDVSIGIMPIDVVQNATFGDCPIEEFTLTVHPNYEVIEDVADGCDPIAGAFISDGAGGFFDVDGDNAITFADACFTAQLNPTGDCTDAATLDYDFTADIDPANPTCYTDLTGTLTCDCTTVCPVYNAITVAAGCTVIDICIGYADADADGIGDNGEDPTGAMMTVDVGAAIGGTAVNDGIFLFDQNGDNVNDAVGYCFTYEYFEQGCDPVPYSALVTLTCPDGTPGVFDTGTPLTLTNADIIGSLFGVPGGGAFYPALTANTTAAVCPTAVDESDAVAAFTTISSPNGVCSTVTGDTPTCGGTGGNATTPIQANPIADPLLSALLGAGTFTCTIDETADHSFTCGQCTPIICEAAAPVVSNDGGDCPADGNADGNNTPFVFAEDGTGNMTAPFITEYIVTDGASGDIVGVFPTLTAAQTAANAEALAPTDVDGDLTMDACIQAINHDGSNLEALVNDLNDQVFGGAILCGIVGCPVSTLEGLFAGLQAGGLTTLDIATVVSIVGAPNVGNPGFDIGALLGVGTLLVDVQPFCYELGNEDCILVAPCPVACPIITDVGAPANSCSSATAQTICVTYDQDPTGLVTADINGIIGTIDAAAMTICYDIPMENTTCDAVTLDLVHAATCDADNDAPILNSGGMDTNGSIGMITIFPVYQVTNPTDDSGTCGVFTVNLMSSNTDGSPATMCQTASLTCMADGDMFTIDYTAAPDAMTNPITAQITDADILACSGTLSSTSGICSSCVTPPTCPIITAVDAPANGCSSTTAQTICVTYDKDPTGLVMTDINGVMGTIDAAAMTICYDIPMENTTCDPVTIDIVHSAICTINNSPILDSGGADTNGSIGMITIFPVYQVTNPTDDSGTCGTFTVNLMSSNTDGSPATMCQTASLTCMADGDVLTIDYTAAPDAMTNPITAQITDADILTCSSPLSLSSAMCAGCTTPTTTIDITDPCSCDAGIDVCGGTISTPPGNIDVDLDGIITDNGIDLVADVIEITVNPPVAGQTYMIGTTTGDAGLALDCSGTPIPEGTPMTETAPGSGVYQFIVYYPADGTGFGTINFTSNTGLPQSITSAAPTYPPCDCEVTCGITVMVDNMCDDKGTDDEGDDEITFFVTVLSNGDPLATTWTDGTLVGQAYDVAVMYGPFPADDNPFTLEITDESNPICTLMVDEIRDCSTLENIPTVGEWGLIILGLLMSIVAIVGIRQRQMTIAYEVKK